MSDELKVCVKCGETRRITNFYRNIGRRSADGLSAWCKDCQREAAKLQRKRNGRVESTELVKNILNDNGIPCISGRYAGFTYCDLAAWGCIPVEAKLSRPDKMGRYLVGFSRNQINTGIFGGVVVAVLDGDMPMSGIYVIPYAGGLDAFWGEHGHGQALAIPGDPVYSTRGKKHTVSEWIKPYRDAFWIIEKYRKNWQTLSKVTP